MPKQATQVSVPSQKRSPFLTLVSFLTQISYHSRSRQWRQLVYGSALGCHRLRMSSVLRSVAQQRQDRKEDGYLV